MAHAGFYSDLSSIDNVNDALNQAELYRDQSQAAAVGADEDATSAAGSATSANTSATNASISESNASTSAAEAAASAASIVGDVAAAEAAADAAALSETNASASASSASTSAADAAASAADAADAAEAAVVVFAEDLAAPTGSGMVGHQRTALSDSISTVGSMLSTMWVSIWEYESLIVSKPNPSDPSTWDWSPAFQGAIDAMPLNPSDPGIHSPKGFANGGCLHVPRGRYRVNSRIDLQRGVRIRGDSRESTQILSFIGSDSVFQYTDNGRYLQDEIGISNLSIWQDASVVATAGAAIDIIEGPATVDSISWQIENVIIEGTFHGIRVGAGVACTVRNVNVSKCVQHGLWQTGTISTTSLVIEASYFHLNGLDGVHIDMAAYVAMIGVGSDSNLQDGYKITGQAITQVSCGAEGNTRFGAHLVGCESVMSTLTTIGNGSHGFQVDNCDAVTLINCTLNGSSGNGINHINVAGPITVIGSVFLGSYATTKINTPFKFLDLSASNGLVGDTNNWAIGATQQPETDSTFAITGNTGGATRNGLKSMAVHTASGTRNTASFDQFVSANTSVTYPLVVGSFVANASKGAAATHTRSAGGYIVQQTTGTTANANLMIDAGAGTVPAGNWNIYSDSALANYLKGQLTWVPPSSATPAANGDLTFERTSNTSLTLRLRGTDGVVRSVALTLA